MSGEEYDRIDGMIDAALAGYSEAEPLPGLESRVVGRLRLRESAVRRVGWGALAVGVAAALAVVALIRPERTPEIGIAAVVSAPAAPGLQRPASAVGTMRPRRRRAAVKELAGLTTEERALVAFAARYPKEITEAQASLRQKGEGPVSVEEIKIIPLQMDGTNSGEQP